MGASCARLARNSYVWVTFSRRPAAGPPGSRDARRRRLPRRLRGKSAGGCAGGSAGGSAESPREPPRSLRGSFRGVSAGASAGSEGILATSCALWVRGGAVRETSPESSRGCSGDAAGPAFRGRSSHGGSRNDIGPGRFHLTSRPSRRSLRQASGLLSETCGSKPVELY